MKPSDPSLPTTLDCWTIETQYWKDFKVELYLVADGIQMLAECISLMTSSSLQESSIAENNNTRHGVEAMEPTRIFAQLEHRCRNSI